MAGGLHQNYTKDTGWYYRSVSDRAAAWTGVEQLYQFLIRNEPIGPKGIEIPLNMVEIGDLIQLSFQPDQFSHSLLVVGHGTQPTMANVRVAAHSEDSDYRPLSSYPFRRCRCLKIS